jgi:hypothetical protein
MWSVIVTTDDGRPPGLAGPFLFGWIAKLVARDYNRRHRQGVDAFAFKIDGFSGHHRMRHAPLPPLLPDATSPQSGNPGTAG